MPYIADYILDGTQPVPFLIEKLKAIKSGGASETGVTTSGSNLVKQGHLVYVEQLKSQLEMEYAGRFVAIEPVSGRFFLGDTGTAALVNAHTAMPDVRFYLTRIGSETAHTVSGNVTRTR